VTPLLAGEVLLSIGPAYACHREYSHVCSADRGIRLENNHFRILSNVVRANNKKRAGERSTLFLYPFMDNRLVAPFNL
jgi:hypothetical protein